MVTVTIGSYVCTRPRHWSDHASVIVLCSGICVYCTVSRKMSELNKKYFVLLVFAVAMLFVGYYLQVGPVSHLALSVIATGKRQLSASLKDQARGLSHNHTLPQSVVDRVKTFVFFMGYSRSGSSIVSSLMDAHPHIVIAYQYNVIRLWNQTLQNNKAYLYGELYAKSQKDATVGWRSEHNMAKSYTLHIDTGWQGRYDNHISVIGDKTADKTVSLFSRSKSNFSEVYTQLQETVEVPVKAVFVIRNPYDIISTRVLYQNPEEVRKVLSANSTIASEEGSIKGIPATNFKSYMKQIKESGDEQAYEDAKFRPKDLEVPIKRVARQAKSISGMIDLIGSENVWQVHNMDLVSNPKTTMMEMCDFFNVHCSDDYIQTCVDSVFKSVSKSRDLVHWPQREKQLVMDKIINIFSFFSRYSYDSD